MSQKGFSQVIIFVIIGVLVLGIVGYFAFANGLPKNLVNTNSSTTSELSRNNSYNSSEYGFSVDVPPGWSYSTSQEKVLTTILVVELKDNNRKVSVPIFVDQKNWETVKAEVSRNFRPEAIEEITFSNQPAIKVVSRDKEINPGYTFRIKHPKRELVLLGTALCIQCSDVALFHQEVEQILNSINFD